MATLFRLLLVCLVFSEFSYGQVQKNKPFDKLKGAWECNTGQGIIKLEFTSPTSLVFDGEVASCQVLEEAVRVNSEEGLVDYPYTLEEGNLTISFPEGYQLLFTRSKVVTTGGVKQAAESSGSAANQYLYGKLCSWSGSYSSYSGTSSSSTSWAWFDGKGSFSYGSESSFSSNAGIAYGSQGGNANTGTYSVKGKYVNLVFPDGSRAQATVNMVQNDGRITELIYNGTLYGKGLCE